MSLQIRLSDLITAIGTDYKQLRVWVTGTSSGTLTSLTTTDKTSVVSAINEINSKPVGQTPGTATEAVAGILRVATTGETTTGTADDRSITALKLQQRLAAYAQPLSSSLTTLAGVVSGAFGRTLLGSADVTAARTSLGLSAVAISGSASDITTGTLPSSVLPALAINDTFVVASQAAMLALSAQRGDIAKRTDLNGQAFVLSADAPATLANWVSLNTTSDVTSVNGQTGVVIVSKSDVSLGNVDNTADSAKPVSAAQQTALNLRLLASANLTDVASASTALANLGGIASSAIGNPETDLVAAYTSAKA